MTLDILHIDLHAHLRDLSTEANSISPSIYDTAMVLRLAPPDPFWPAFDWLLREQQEDGGWLPADCGERARTVPTLAAILALHDRSQRSSTREAIEKGLSFLRRNSSAWCKPLTDDLPVGVELLLPMLLAEAHARGMDLPAAPYAELTALGMQRRAKISRIPPHLIPGSSASHSWEAFGESADARLVHPVSGVGASPAATAAWLRMAPSDSPARAMAVDYLRRAALATGVGIPGVVPTVFPIGRFMETYSSHTLAQAELAAASDMATILGPRFDELAAEVEPEGLGFTDGLSPDADDTAAVLGALQALGRRPSLGPLRRFVTSTHVVTYPGELQPSAITTARAIQVLHTAGEDVTHLRQWLAARQEGDGRWPADKWNSNWIYTTWQVILALREDPFFEDVLQHVCRILIAFQYRDGGWGISHSTIEATAYGLLALAALPRSLRLPEVDEAIRRAREWLYAAYQPFTPSEELHWTGKEPYRPTRLSRIIILAAMLTPTAQ